MSLDNGFPVAPYHQDIEIESIRQLSTAIKCAKGYAGYTNITILGTKFQCTIYGCPPEGNNKFYIHYNRLIRKLVSESKKLYTRGNGK